MKELIEDFKKEEIGLGEGLLYGFLLPLGILAFCLLSEWINSL